MQFAVCLTVIFSPQDWGYIRTNMRALGKNSVINRIRRRDLMDVKAPQARDAEQYLGQTNKIMVRLASAGASTFYIWVCRISTSVL